MQQLEGYTTQLLGVHKEFWRWIKSTSSSIEEGIGGLNYQEEERVPNSSLF